MSRSSRNSALYLSAAFALAMTTQASAHPHVWVTVRDEIVFNNGFMTGVEHHWTFDDMYASMAIEGLDKNADGNYSREELKELAQTNIDGLKDFDYFTYATISEKKVVFGPPRDYWLEYKNSILTLHYFLPLQSPLKPDAKGLRISVTDPSYFIAFSFAKDNPVLLMKEAPANCTAALVSEKVPDDQKALNQAFATQMMPIGDGLSGDISVQCRK